MREWQRVSLGEITRPSGIHNAGACPSANLARRIGRTRVDQDDLIHDRQGALDAFAQKQRLVTCNDAE
jgi:hypothetical protein